MSATTKAFARGVSYLADKKGIAQSVIAQELVMDPSYISRVFSGKQSASDKLKDLLSALVEMQTYEIIKTGDLLILKDEKNPDENNSHEMLFDTIESGQGKNEEIDSKQIATRLSEFRELSKLSIKQLSDKTGTQKKTIYNYEGGSRKVHVDFICKLNQNLHVSPTWLVTGRGTPFCDSTMENVICRLRSLFDMIEAESGYVGHYEALERQLAYMQATIETLAGFLLNLDEVPDEIILLIKKIIEWTDCIIPSNLVEPGEGEMVSGGACNVVLNENDMNGTIEFFQKLNKVCERFLGIFS